MAKNNMIDKSTAYKTLKQQHEDLFNFVVLTCVAVPNLEKVVRYIDDKDEGFSSYAKREELKDNQSTQLKYKLAKSIHFENDAGIERVKRIFKFKRKVKNDKWSHQAILENSLSKYVLLSSFSFFEAYIQNLIKEVIEFHGGEISINEKIKNRINDFQSVKTLTSKLKVPFNKGKTEKYNKLNQKLDGIGFVFPSEIFALQGIKRLITYTKDSKTFTASKIPDILNDLLFNVEEIWNEEEPKKTIRAILDEIREWRNDIAHGNQEKTTSERFRLKNVLEYNNFLRKLAIKIDAYFLEHLFVVDMRLRK